MPELCGIFTSIKHVYVASKILTVLPLNLESTNHSIKVSISRISVLFTILTTLTSLVSGLTYPFHIFKVEGSCFICLFFSSDSKHASDSTVLNHTKYKLIAMKIVNRLLFTAMTLATAIFALRYSQRLVKFFYKLQNTDYYFRALMNHSVRKVDCCISARIIAVLVLFTSPATFYYMYSEFIKGYSTFSAFSLPIVIMWESFSSTVCEAQFINFTYLLTVRFRIINNYLEDLMKPNSKNFNAREYPPSIHKTKIVDNNVCLEETTSSVTLLSIELCRHCHRCLCELIQDLNSIYKLVLFSTLSACFVKILLNVFSIVSEATSERSSGMFKEVSKRVFWVFFFASRFFALILFACRTVREGVSSRILLAELNSATKDIKVKKELLLFYNQITTRKTEFSAISLFTLSTELITSAVGVGTTYLVILVQFQAPSD